MFLTVYWLGPDANMISSSEHSKYNNKNLMATQFPCVAQLHHHDLHLGTVTSQIHYSTLCHLQDSQGVTFKLKLLVN